MYKNIDLARKAISNKQYLGVSEKGHAWKESGVMTQGRKEVEVGTLLLGNEKKQCYCQ